MSIEILLYFWLSIFSDQFRLNKTHGILLTVLFLILAILGYILYYCVCRKRRSKRKEEHQINPEFEFDLNEFQTMCSNDNSDNDE